MREGKQVEIKLSVCDVCADTTREIRTYEIGEGGRKATTDRCEEHGSPFEESLRGVAGQATARPRPAEPRKQADGRKSGDGRRARGTRVTTMEEIERKKAERS